VKVHVQFFSHLKDVMGSPELEVEIADGAKVSDLLATLAERAPALRDWESSILIGAGVEFVDRAYIIQPNDQIAIMPPVQGG
jgi:molybdopterin converting factor small subunit